MAIVIATADEAVRAALLPALAGGGWAVRPVPDWERLVGALASPEHKLVLVDPALPRFDAPLLDALARSVAHAPRVRSLGRAPAPLVRVPATPRAVARLARQVLGPGGLDAEERRELEALGLGADPFSTLAAAAASPLPVWLSGERGTGKERAARLIHRLSTPTAPFSVLAPVHRWDPQPGPGTLYLEAAHRRDASEVRSLLREATPAGWRVVAGSRGAEPPGGVDWLVLPIPPLRDRPNDLAVLAHLYLERHTERVGGGPRRMDRGFLARIHAWKWPGNHRELEQFVAEAASRMHGRVLRGRDVPEDLRTQLVVAPVSPSAATGGFEEMADQRLRPVVAAYEPGAGPSLHALVVGSTERVLIHLVLDRTGGNRKRAAELLGVARNTLQARIGALGLSATRD